MPRPKTNVSKVQIKKPVKKADLNKIEPAAPNYYLRENKKIPQDFYITPTTIWTVESVSAALATHERGQFTMSGRLSDTVFRDSRVSSVVNTRVLGVIGLPFEWKWPDDYSPNDKDLAALEVVKKYWPYMITQPLLATILTNVILMGFSVSSIYWEQEGDIVLPKLTPFHPSNIQFDISSWEFMAYTLQQGTARIDPTDPNWITFCQLDAKKPWMKGCIRPLAYPWLQKTYTLADWRGFNAANGQPIRVLEMPVESGTPPEEDAQNFIRDISTNARLGAPILLPNGATFKMVQPESNSSDTFKDAIEQANVEIAVAVLGQNLTTDSGSKAGSYALGKIHKDIMLEYLEADTSMLNETIYNQLLRVFYEINFGPDYVVPLPHYNSQPPEDEETLAKTLQSKSLAISSLATALAALKEQGLLDKVDLDQLLLNYGLPMKSQVNSLS